MGKIHTKVAKCQKHQCILEYDQGTKMSKNTNLQPRANKSSVCTLEATKWPSQEWQYKEQIVPQHTDGGRQKTCKRKIRKLYLTQNLDKEKEGIIN